MRAGCIGRYNFHRSVSSWVQSMGNCYQTGPAGFLERGGLQVGAEMPGALKRVLDDGFLGIHGDPGQLVR